MEATGGLVFLTVAMSYSVRRRALTNRANLREMGFGILDTFWAKVTPLFFASYACFWEKKIQKRHNLVYLYI